MHSMITSMCRPGVVTREYGFEGNKGARYEGENLDSVETGSFWSPALVSFEHHLLLQRLHKLRKLHNHTEIYVEGYHLLSCRHLEPIPSVDSGLPRQFTGAWTFTAQNTGNLSKGRRKMARRQRLAAQAAAASLRSVTYHSAPQL